ncbi:hypothetical protein PVAND_010434 [Polypedilum vanderplanki]|uniref:CCHC-type domain-containing protein n=1 Tax=Polypedilum vanderplanki TaxID=319348 RepID=A0A9J6CGE7_POLVA|nr:hypothetical protein PVAND_010434 [Polypedilum vanderplanki]
MGKCSGCRREAAADSFINCSLCSESFHSCFAKRSVNEVNELNVSGFKWCCAKCAPNCEPILKNLNSLNKIISDLCVKVDNLEASLLRSEKNDSYSNVLKKASENVVVVKSKNENIDNKLIIEKLKTCLNPKNDKIQGFRTGKEKVLLQAAEGSVSSLISKVKNTLGKDFEVSQIKKSTPKIKVIGIDECDADDDVALIKLMIDQNENVFEKNDNITIVKKYKPNLSSKRVNAIIEVSENVYCKALSNKVICLNWSRCKVYDARSLIRCYKCSRLSHVKEKCNAKICCGKCAGEHDTQECTSNKAKCINCVEANKNFNLKLSINHPSWDKALQC